MFFTALEAKLSDSKTIFFDSKEEPTIESDHEVYKQLQSQNAIDLIDPVEFPKLTMWRESVKMR